MSNVIPESNATSNTITTNTSNNNATIETHNNNNNKEYEKKGKEKEGGKGKEKGGEIPARMRISDSKRLVVDILAGCSAGLGVSPFVTTVDKAIFQNASGQKPMLESLKSTISDIVKHPGKFFGHPSYRWIITLYSCTYMSANFIEHACETNHWNKEIPKFIGVSAVNISICIAKDRAFSRMFGTKPPSKVPKKSLLLWLTRDCMTIAMSFNLPPYLAEQLHDQGFFGNYKNALVFSQILCPVSIQLLSTPLHLLGSDFYNNPDTNFKHRLQFIRKEYAKTATARMARILPSFGIGGVANRAMHEYLSNKALVTIGDQID